MVIQQIDNKMMTHPPPLSMRGVVVVVVEEKEEEQLEATAAIAGEGDGN